MKINKPKFWGERNNLFSYLLLPITLLVLFFIFLKRRIIQPFNFNIPIICVGNIYIGGTGKTPTSIAIAKEIVELGKNPVILRKFYKNHKDEHDLIKSNFNHLILKENRIDGVKEAENRNYDIVILDDGLQDYKIKKNLSIVCFNSNQLIGNGLVLPSGPLREKLAALKHAQIVIINGNKDKYFENKILNVNKKLEIFYSYYKPLNINQFKNKKLLALAGIGNPENFFQLLEENNLIIEKKKIFPDHYKISKNEIQNIVNEAERKNYQIIMTEKDYFKIKDYKIDKVNYLKVLLKIKNKDNLLKKIKDLYV